MIQKMNNLIRFETVSPDTYKKGTAVSALYYGFHQSRFGKYLLAVTAQNWIVSLDFEKDEQNALERMRFQWPSSALIHQPASTRELASRLFAGASTGPIHLLAKGTPFQLKVWQCLLHIPFGETRTYQWVAKQVETPRGYQAVGNAIGKNPIAFLIPCHRVTRKNGQISNYRWGAPRKTALLAWEKSQTISSSAVRVRSM